MRCMVGTNPLRGGARLHSRFAEIVVSWFVVIVLAAGIAWPNGSARAENTNATDGRLPLAQSIRHRRLHSRSGRPIVMM